jgi:Tfp pilus assembly protein PilF
MRFCLIVLILSSALLTGCESVQNSVREIRDSIDPGSPRPTSEIRERSPAERLNDGIRSFETGQYGAAQRQLQSSLALGLYSRHDQAKAYKYLAFTYCVTQRLPECRQEFRNALAADPGFSLNRAEAGHPAWGPAFRSARGY